MKYLFVFVQVTVGIIACVEVTTTVVTTATTTLPTTAVPSTTTPLSSTVTTTATLAPTTTTMNYCVEQNGMNQPLTIQPNQLTFNPSFDQTTPLSNINPTSTSSGINIPSNTQIKITLDQPTTLTVIYLPVDRPNKPSNVKQFAVAFIYQNGTITQPIFSTTASTSTTTTTTSSPSAAQTTTTPSPTALVPPSDASPRLDLSPNVDLPAQTTIVIMITSTINDADATGVRIDLYVFIFVTKFLGWIEQR